MKTKTLITTAALIGACSLFAATSAIADDQRIEGHLDTLSGDGGTKTFVDGATVTDYTQTANTTLAGKGTIVNVENKALSVLTIASGADIEITGTYENSVSLVNPSTIHLNANAKLTAKELVIAHPVHIEVAKDSVLNVKNLEFACGGGGNHEVAIKGLGGGNAGTINADVLNVRNYTVLSVWGGAQLNIGADGIISTGASAGNYTLRFGGDSHIGASANWSSNLKIGLGLNTTALTTFNPTAGKTITLMGEISNQGILKKDEAGTLILTGANTYAGGTIISGGTLVAGHNNALGTGAITVENGGRCRLPQVLCLTPQKVLRSMKAQNLSSI